MRAKEFIIKEAPAATSYSGKVEPPKPDWDEKVQQAALTQNGRQPMYRDIVAQTVSQVDDRPGHAGKIVVDRTPSSNIFHNVTGDWAQGDSYTDNLGQSSTRGGGGYGMGEKTATTQAAMGSANSDIKTQNAAAIDAAAQKKFADPNDRTTKLAQAERTRKFEKTVSDMIKTNANAQNTGAGSAEYETPVFRSSNLDLARKNATKAVDRRELDPGNRAGTGKMNAFAMDRDINAAGNQAAYNAYKLNKKV